MEHIGNAIVFLNNYIWSSALVVFVICSSIYFSIRYRFTQVRNLRDMVKNLIRNKGSESGISTFASFWTTMAGRVGVGNIAGVSLAVYMGGPGVVFWMWVTSVFLAATSFTECSMGQLYKIKVDGQYRGGAFYCAERALGWKWFGKLFAIVMALGLVFMLPGVQANMISEGLYHSMSVPTWLSGLFGAVLLGVIIFGGIRRISGFSAVLVPIKVGLYLLLVLIVLIVHFRAIPTAFAWIFSAAFNQGSLFGGMMGVAVQHGVRRAAFASGAGMGAEPPAAAAAETDHPVRQGLVNSFGIYVDILVCTCTALMILVTDCFNTSAGYIGAGSAQMAGLAAAGTSGVVFPQEAVGTFLPGLGAIIMAILVALFAFTMIAGCAYEAETALAYLFGDAHETLRKRILMVFKAALLFVYFYYSTTTSAVAWAGADLAAGLMIWLNVFLMLILSPKAVAILKDYEAQRAAGQEPFFDPDKVGIKNADLWKEINKEKIAAAKQHKSMERS